MKVEYFQIFIPILLVLLGGVGWLYRHEKEKRLEIEKQLSVKKYDVYVRLLTVFFNILKQVKKGQSTNADKLVDTMIEIKKDIIIFGSDEVLNNFFNWEKKSQSKESLKALSELVISVRRDMGNPKTKITSADFLKSLVQDEETLIELREQGYIL